MIFASKTQPDPFPYRVGPVRLAYEGTLGGVATVHHPRPFDPNMNNEPNPLLTDYRLEIAHTTWRHRDPRDWLAEVTERWPGVVIPFTADHIDHARRVLTRLANLGGTR